LNVLHYGQKAGIALAAFGIFFVICAHYLDSQTMPFSTNQVNAYVENYRALIVILGEQQQADSV
jgi:hypothetical protein